LAPDQTTLSFSVQAAADARVGRFPSILCRISAEEQGETVVQTTGTGQLRVDAPLPQVTPQPAEPPS
jgi:hypothetical protein